MQVRKRVAIVDYGMGNLFNLKKAISAASGVPTVIQTPAKLKEFEYIVLPGVGSFGPACASLNASGLGDAIKERASAGARVLGICLGMQLLADKGSEDGENLGLGLIDGHVHRIPDRSPNGDPLVLPHVGWCKLNTSTNCKDTILERLPTSAHVYCVHSFVFSVENTANKIATTVYGGHKLCMAIRRENVTGLQFHPELSGTIGLEILKAFLDSP